MDTLPIINKTYDLYKKVTKLVGTLEKRYRFTLGKKLEDTVLEILEELIITKNAPKPHKAIHLQKAGALEELCILHLRLCLDLKLTNETTIFQAQAVLQDVSRQTGGWLKSLQ